MSNINVNSLKDYIRGKEFELAKQIIGLTNGKDTKEHHQTCPFCGGTDRFWFNPEKRTFHCRQCRFNGDIIALVEKVRGVSFAETLNIIADAAGYIDIDAMHVRHAVNELTKTLTNDQK
jgi:phage/plasmid primase-like uncharacterized protein